MVNHSTNEIMFDAQQDLLYGVDNNWMQIFDFVKSYYNTNGNEALAGQNFSHDNWSLVYVWFAVNSKETNMEELPLFGHHSTHPVRWLYYFFMKYPGLGTIFLPIIYLDMFIAGIIKTKKNRHGHIEIPTSDKLQAYFKLMGIEARGGLGVKTATRIMDVLVRYSVGGWDNCFDIYYAKGHRVWEAYKYYSALKKQDNLLTIG